MCLPVKSSGMAGDSRRYGYVISLRAVDTVDFMTALAAQQTWEFLDEVSRSICDAIPEVSPVAYDISGKSPAAIECE